MEYIKTLLMLFGGQSSEHEVSRKSAASILNNINSDKYNILKVGIKKDGAWLLTEASAEAIESGAWESCENNRPVQPALNHSRRLFITESADSIYIDVVFPMLHGKNGEDGTMQGLFQIAGIPFVGSDTKSSAACMDKAVTKALVDQAEVCEQAKCCVTHRGCDEEEAAQSIDGFFDSEYPLFVKPANSGSSVGISKVEDCTQLPHALKTAFAEDGKVLVEEAIVGREIEIAILGNRESDRGLQASCLGEIFAANEFYDYSAKYEDVGSKTAIVEDLPDFLVEEIRETALKIYEIMGCDGMARVDFFLMPGLDGGYHDGKVVFNEINTIPGFTKISMYPQLWEASGVPYDQLIDRLIELAIERDKE